MNESTEELQAQAEQDVIDAWTLFQVALTRKGPYPMRELKGILEAVTRYTAAMQDSLFIHKTVAGTFSGFREFLEVERKRVPGEAPALGDRIETILFSGYDPYFEGDEPPGF